MIIDLSGKGEIPTVSLDYQLKREVKPLLVDYSTRHGQPEYYFDNPDTNYGLCYDAIEKKFVAWAGEFEC